MDRVATTRFERILGAASVLIYVALLIILGLISLGMMSEQRRIKAGPWTTATVGATQINKANIIGEITYHLDTNTGSLDCREKIELGRAQHRFHSGQIIRIVIGNQCGEALSVEKWLAPKLYFAMFVGAILFGLYAFRNGLRRSTKKYQPS